MNEMENEDYLLASYDYELPESQIAQYPAKERGTSRLLALDRNGIRQPAHAMFAQLPELLPQGALLVANNSRVMPARLAGKRESGGKAEFLLLTPLGLIDAKTEAEDSQGAIVEGLLRPAAKIPVGALLTLAGGISAQILEKGEFGQCRAFLRWRGCLADALAASGRLPLPPYIRREPTAADALRYQTIYASQTGSVAAPTAGLHFTQSLREELALRGFGWVELSLHVGYGTFSPVRCADIRQHKMHSEYVELDEESAAAIRQARADGRPVVAVGTTSLRALEGIARLRGGMEAYAGFINLFVYPGFEFQAVDGLITNFHLPCSTLLMLVAALGGRRHVLAAYAEAVARGYHFFSYGDAMLLA